MQACSSSASRLIDELNSTKNDLAASLALAGELQTFHRKWRRLISRNHMIAVAVTVSE